MKPDPAVGLCSVCRFANVKQNAKGGRFWRCARADTESRYLRYPPLPVVACVGHEPLDPDAD